MLHLGLNGLLGQCQIRALCGPQTPPTGLEVWLNPYSERRGKQITRSTEPLKGDGWPLASGSPLHYST